MEQIACIGDVHGNLVALESVLGDIKARGIDRIHFLGDAIGKGPQSPEVVDVLFDRCESMVRGNWEDCVIHNKIASAPFFKQQLGAVRLAKLDALPYGIFFNLSGKTIKLFHGRNTISTVIYANADKSLILEALDALDEPSDVVGFADIHQPLFRMCEGRTLFNTGSVGNPCDKVSQSSYAILRGAVGDTSAALSVELVRVPYDHQKAINATLACPDLPHGDLFIKEIQTGLYQR